MIDLNQAKELVRYLENNEQRAANDLLAMIFLDTNRLLFNEIGKLTRELHDSIVDYQADKNIVKLTEIEIPTAMERLNFVLEKTESAANRTIDAVDSLTPVTTHLQKALNQVHLQLQTLASSKTAVEAFTPLYQQIDKLLNQIDIDSNTLHHELTEILMAQDFQDLTGQVVNQVITLFKNIEILLIKVLTSFEAQDQQVVFASTKNNKEKDPVVNKTQEEKKVLENQNDVDDLLSSLGF